MTLDSHYIFLSQIEKNPSKIYLYGKDCNYSFKEYFSMINELSNELVSLCKQEKKTEIFVNISNPQFLMLTIWACIFSKIDIILIPLIFDKSKLNTIIGEKESKVVITDLEDSSISSYKIKWKNLFKKKIKNKETESNKFESIKDTDTTFYFFTSGTTGEPKWISIPYMMYKKAITCLMVNKLNQYTIDQTVLVTSPLFHSYGVACLLEYSFSNSSIILPKEQSFIGPLKELLNIKVAHTVTAIEGVPYFHKQLSLIIKKTNLIKLKHIGFGGGALNEHDVNKIMNKYSNLTYSVRYGMTETPSIISLKLFKPPYKDNLKSCGKVIPLYTVRIVDQFNNLLPCNTEGEIEILGDCISGRLSTNDFFSTGDVGYINEDGELFITDRISSFIKHKGFRVSPLLVENVIGEHNEINDCRVFSLGSKLIAEVLTKNENFDSSQLIDFLKGKLPDYAIPNNITKVISIPRTITGKIKR